MSFLTIPSATESKKTRAKLEYMAGFLSAIAHIFTQTKKLNSTTTTASKIMRSLESRSMHIKSGGGMLGRK